MSEDEKVTALAKLKHPTPDYIFPKTGKINLKCQIAWFFQFKWLHYSFEQNGVYCKTCVFFSPNDGVGKGGHQNPGKLVLEKFDNWKKALGDKGYFKLHSESDYHKTCQYRHDHFLAVKSKNVDPINIQINTMLKKEIEANRLKVIPIVKTVIFCGRQGIALRGHRDSEMLLNANENINEPECNDGNFRQLLRFRIDAGDEFLKSHLTSCAKNATYLSWKIQNEILSACNNLILQNLVCAVNKAKGFSVLADETSDIFNKEQLTICVRYVNLEQKKIREDFLQFVEVTDVSGKALAQTILQNLEIMGLELNYLIGQGYDGAAAMSGKFNGTQKHINDKYPMALYIHCGAHCLNLAISFSCNVTDIRNCMGTMQAICNFFGYPKRQNVLKISIQNELHESKLKKLKKFCPTRWVERHDTVLVFHELQPAVVDALNEISTWKDNETSALANQLSSSIHQLRFQVALLILVKVFSISAPLSKFLQTENLDLESALEFADMTQSTIKQIRDNANAEFEKIFKEVEDVCSSFDITVSVPRTSSRQKNRSNVMNNNPIEYYRISTFIPFLDNFLEQLHGRFLEHRAKLKSFNCLLPKTSKQISEETFEDFKIMFNFYTDILSDSINLTSLEVGYGELKLWYNSCAFKSPNLSSTITELFFHCNPDFFPLISKLLQILITLPVTTATGERSFSSLRRLKNYLRNTTGQMRLNGLAVLNIHQDINVDPSMIIDEMAKTSKRRLNLNL